MRDKLVKSVERLCGMFPPLKPDVVFSEVLSSEQVSLFSGFVNGDFDFSGKGVIRIRDEDVSYIGSIIAASSAGELHSDAVKYLRENPSIKSKLHGAYHSILTNSLVDSCPIFSSCFLGFDNFHKMFHLSIHHVLENNGLSSGDSDFDEALVTYLHKRVSGKKVILHYLGGGERFLRLSKEIASVLKDVPDKEVIPIVRSFLTRI